MVRPWIYIASPFNLGDNGLNVRFQCTIWDQLMDDGLVWPHAPLWNHFQHLLYPRKSGDMIAFDNAMIPRLDACLRLDAICVEMNYYQHESSGADAEVILFLTLDKPVFYSISTMYAWVKRLNYQQCATPRAYTNADLAIGGDHP